MKQKKCPQCKNLILVTAPTCLYCGRPNVFVTNNYVQRKWDKEYIKNKRDIFRIVVSKQILFIFIILFITLLITLK